MDVDQLGANLLARERVREAQQGLGRHIISMKSNDHQLVAVGKTLYWSKGWKTFTDFLGHYLKTKLTAEWGNAEIAKPLAERHPILQWYDALCRFQAETIKTPGEVVSTDMNGLLACYYGVAYSLYLLDHNVELQDRLLKRLRDPRQFQGAYYELLVASTLIRAGFELTLEDEADPSVKHCEFSAVSKTTGKKYWVEAKMRAVVGQLGRTAADGTTSKNPISRMVGHLNSALAKPAADERMIFIDLNAEMAHDVSQDAPPDFADRATRRLERYESKELKSGETAYVIVTNMNFHRDLHAPAQLIAFGFGLGMPDFNRAGMCGLAERHKRDLKHADAFRAMEAFAKLLVLPSTFDGSLPGPTLHNARPPVVIGETYNFEGAGPEGNDLIGTVTTAAVLEGEKMVMVGVSAADGKSYLLKEPMSDVQLADYRAHPDAYFGRIVRPSKGIKTPQDLFEFFMEGHRGIARDELLKRLGGLVPRADEMEHEELLAIYAEGLVASSGMFKIVDGVIIP